MRANIDAQRGMVFAEALSGYLGSFIGRPAAHAMLEELSRTAFATNRDLSAVASEAIEADDRLRDKVDLEHWQSLFDPVAAAAPAAAAARAHLLALRRSLPKDDPT